jgi:hypothetical protein
MNSSDSPESLKHELLNLEDEYIRLFKEVESVLIAHGFPPYSSNIPLSIAEVWTRNRGYVRFSPLEFRRFLDWDQNKPITSASEGVEPKKVHWSFYKDAQKLKVVSFYYPKYKFKTIPFRYCEHNLLVDLFSRLFLCQRRWETLVIIYHRATWHSGYEDSSKLNMASLEVTKGIMSKRSREELCTAKSAEQRDDQLQHSTTISPFLPSSVSENTSSSIQTIESKLNRSSKSRNTTVVNTIGVNRAEDISKHRHLGVVGANSNERGGVADVTQASGYLATKPISPFPKYDNAWRRLGKLSDGKWNWTIKIYQEDFAEIAESVRREVLPDESTVKFAKRISDNFLLNGKSIKIDSFRSALSHYSRLDERLTVIEEYRNIVRWKLKL